MRKVATRTRKRRVKDMSEKCVSTEKKSGTSVKYIHVYVYLYIYREMENEGEARRKDSERRELKHNEQSQIKK